VTRTPRVFDGVQLPVGPDPTAGFARADITVAGLDPAGPSYEVRIFLNNPGADAGSEPTSEQGYAGSIYVYGYGAPAPSAPLEVPDPGGQRRTPMPRSVIATDAVRAAAGHGPEVSITLVPIAFAETDPGVDLSGVDVSVQLV
jgi:hypothetical protein